MRLTAVYLLNRIRDVVMHTYTTFVSGGMSFTQLSVMFSALHLLQRRSTSRDTLLRKFISSVIDNTLVDGRFAHRIPYYLQRILIPHSPVRIFPPIYDKDTKSPKWGTLITFLQFLKPMEPTFVLLDITSRRPVPEPDLPADRPSVKKSI